MLPPWKMPDEHRARVPADDLAQREVLLGAVAPLAGTGSPSASMCAVEMSVENPSAPAAQRIGQRRLQLRAACASSAAVTFASAPST